MPGFSMDECWYPFPTEEERVTEDAAAVAVAAAKPGANTPGAVSPGFCASTEPGGDCNTDPSGSFASSNWKNQTLEACVARVRVCKNANYVSFSAANEDCSWYKACDVDHLHTGAAKSALL
jgi:DMSO/TMAO reductase YedYZ molybdopterin-dependent catalytic subunit